MIRKDCGLTMIHHGDNHHDAEESFPEHINRCCDCADQEAFGMSDRSRGRPRP